MTSATKDIVILGAAYGGISCAHYILKHVIPSLPNPESYKIVLVNPSEDVLGRPACPRALISDQLLDQSKLFTDIQEQLKQYPEGSYRFVQGLATELNHSDRSVTVQLADGSQVKLEYHALIIATGSSTPSPLLSVNKDTETLRKDWESFRVALTKVKHIVVGGGGPAGIETAGELGNYLNGRPGWFSWKSAEPKVRITVVTSGTTILPYLRPAFGKTAEGQLADVGVQIMKSTRITDVTPSGAGTGDVASKATITLDSGEKVDADLYVPAFGLQANTKFMDASLLDTDGRIDTNTKSLRVDKAGERVYAIGDCSNATRPAVHLTINAIPVLCTNLKRDLLLAAGKSDSEAGKERVHEEDKRETQFVPTGPSKGVGAAMGWGVPSFFVWMIKGRDYWLWTLPNLWSGKQWAKEQ